MCITRQYLKDFMSLIEYCAFYFMWLDWQFILFLGLWICFFMELLNYWKAGDENSNVLMVNIKKYEFGHIIPQMGWI